MQMSETDETDKDTLIKECEYVGFQDDITSARESVESFFEGRINAIELKYERQREEALVRYRNHIKSIDRKEKLELFTLKQYFQEKKSYFSIENLSKVWKVVSYLFGRS